MASTQETKAFIRTKIVPNENGEIDVPEILAALDKIIDLNLALEASEDIESSGTSLIYLAHSFVPGTVKVLRNGVRLPASSFAETDENSITLAFEPEPEETITVDYKYLP